MVTRRHGFTLIETLLSVVIVSILLIMVVPKVGSALARHNLRGARTTVVNATALARAAAQEGSRSAWLKVDGTRALVVARPRMVADAFNSTADTVGPIRDLAEEYGVTIAAGSNPDSIRFAASGLGGFGAAQTLTLSHGPYSETITVDGMGRVQK